MNNLIFCFLFSLLCPFINEKVKVDGKLDEKAWENSLKIKEFVEVYPNFGKEPDEKTEVLIFQNKDGIYIGFKCFTKNRKVDVSPSGDYLIFYLDMHYTRKEAYCYLIWANEARYTYLLKDDGESIDKFEGIWEAKVSYTADTLFEIEVFIPWKGIMGGKNWGFNCVRNLPGDKATYSLIPYNASIGEKMRVSKFLTLEGIEVKRKIFSIEALPTYLHLRDFNGGKENRIGIDGNFKIENLKFVFTYKPDFGEIEADPYKLNYTKYALFYEEKRPFFLEGYEIFRFGTSNPLNIFYSRQIGKTLPSGKIIPIIFGSKMFFKFSHFETGLLYSLCDKTIDSSDFYYFYFPKTHYLITSLKYKFSYFLISQINSIRKYENEIKYLSGYEFSFQKNDNFINIQFILNKLKKIEIENSASKIYFSKRVNKFEYIFEFQKIGDKFNDQEIGFIPWIGNESYNFSINYSNLLKKYKILTYYLLPSIYVSKELEEPYVNGFLFSSGCSFINNWIFYSYFGYKKDYELGKRFSSPSFGIVFSTDPSKPIFILLTSSNLRTYNYLKNYVGYISQNNLNLFFRFLGRNQFGLNLVQYFQLDTLNKVSETTYSLNPSIYISPFKRFSINFYMHLPFTTIKEFKYLRLGGYIDYGGLYKNEIITNYNYWKDYENKIELLNSFGIKIKINIVF
jgi:hypothetical protein